MRPELEMIEKIERYLKNELTASEIVAFETQMANDPALKEEVRLQQEIMKGIERIDLKQKIYKARKSYKQGKSFTKWGLGGLAVVVLVSAFLFYRNLADHNAYENNSLPEYNERGEKLWADADRNISAQTFSIDASKDTVIETKGGIVMVVPAHTFVDGNGHPAEGNVELAVKEALDPATMINGGLSTKSGNDLLESGGMFFTDARKDGKILKIDPSNGIYAEIPTDYVRPGMQLFQGNRMADGTIDWVNPKPVEHDLMAVDIQKLNFYPPFYLDSLKQWNFDIKNKKFTDSLYYSFASLFSQVGPMSYEMNSADLEVLIDETDTGKKESPDKNFETDTAKRQNINDRISDSLLVDYGINPAKIKAIWNEKFQNTILATREFEERLRWIHLRCDPFILDMYVNNLDKSLYYIDSMIASRWPADSEALNIFQMFAQRHDGKVKNGSKEFEMLSAYYARKTKAFTEAATKTEAAFWNKQAQLDDEAVNKQKQHDNDDAKRETQNFIKELKLNMEEAYRQLDKPWVTNTVYRVQINATGWNNVDRYVLESTFTRTTLDYTDPQTGKKAVIKYSSFTVQVEKWNEYGRLYVYLLPDQLNSFMRLNGAGGKYDEKLNELMKYNLVCVAYKDEQAWYYMQDNVQAKDYTGINLTMISQDELNQKLHNSGNRSQYADVFKENEFLLFDIKDQKRQKHNLMLQELKSKVMVVIFPCIRAV